MEIHTVIQQRRRALGLTQEQVAEYLGVTTPAVNKWEKGSTCPDIGLLPPLARLLEIDLNTLFSFHTELTPQELTHFCKEVTKIIREQGFAAGFSAAQEKIHTYPNSDKLLHTLALQLQGLLAAAGLEDDQAMAYMKKIDAWYEKLTNSDEPAIRNGACFMLSSRAIGEGQYDKAQEYLDRMPSRGDIPDKRPLQASIYLGRQQPEEALKILQQFLISTVSDVQSVLYRLIDANIALGDENAAAYAAEKTAKLAEIFDLHPYAAAAGPFLLASAKKDVRQSVELLRKMFASMSCQWNLQASPLYHQTVSVSSAPSMANMTRLLVQGLKAPEYAYLQEDAEFQALMKSYDPSWGSQA